MAITNPSNELLQPLCSNDAEMVGFEIKKPPKVSFKQKPGINNKTMKQLQISICFPQKNGGTLDLAVVSRRSVEPPRTPSTPLLDAGR